ACACAIAVAQTSERIAKDFFIGSPANFSRHSVLAGCPSRRLLSPHCKIPLRRLCLASRLGTELVDAELDLELPDRAAESERHPCVILVDDRRSGVLAD